MIDETDPQHLALPELVQRCEQETKLYFKRQEHDNKFCFELFRRAIQENDTSIWENIIPCYSGLVASWVSQHPGYESSGEKIEYFVNGAFAKLVLNLTKEKFQGFSDLGFVLSYLKLCVHSVVVDHYRAADQASLYTLEEVGEERSMDASPEEQVVDRATQHDIWEIVKERLHDEKERIVMQGLFVFELKPRELYDQMPTMFTDVDEIYRIKQNVVARLRRDPDIKKLFDKDA
jgi:hypothetical protein